MFSESNDFTRSNKFSESNDFSKSYKFSESNDFTNSDINPRIFIGNDDDDDNNDKSKNLGLIFGVPIAGAAVVASSIIAAVIITQNKANIPAPEAEPQDQVNVNNTGPPTSIENPVFNQMDTDNPFNNDFEEQLP